MDRCASSAAESLTAVNTTRIARHVHDHLLHQEQDPLERSSLASWVWCSGRLLHRALKQASVGAPQSASRVPLLGPLPPLDKLPSFLRLCSRQRPAPFPHPRRSTNCTASHRLSLLPSSASIHRSINCAVQSITAFSPAAVSLDRRSPLPSTTTPSCRLSAQDRRNPVHLHRALDPPRRAPSTPPTHSQWHQRCALSPLRVRAAHADPRSFSESTSWS